MSLDVYLYGPPAPSECCCCECGNAHRVVKRERFFSSNITHNLITMAEAAGLYGAVWRPVDNGVTTAAQLVPHLERGLKRLRANPERFRRFDHAAGWGTYEQLVPWLEQYLAACRAHPDAVVEVSR